MNSTYFLNLVAGNIFQTQTTPAIPTTMYLGVSSTAPTVSGTNITEPSSANGYARIALTNLSTPTNGVITNTAAIDFAKSTGTWGVMTHYVVFDAATSGNFLFGGELALSRTVESDTILSFETGALTLSVVTPS